MSETYTKHCAECGKEYNAKLPIRAHESKYCSNKCRWRHRKRLHRARQKYNEYSKLIQQIAAVINHEHTTEEQ